MSYVHTMTTFANGIHIPINTGYPHLPSAAGQVAFSDGTGIVNWAAIDPASDLEGTWPNLTIKDSILRDPNTVNLVESMPRYAASSTAIDMATGTMRFNFFTPTNDVVCTKTSMCSGTTTATSGSTLIRWGFYTVDAITGAGTLVCAIANDATLFAALSTEYERSFSTGGGLPSSYTFLAGQRYAGGLLIVATTGGNIRGHFANNAASCARAPRLVGAFAGQTNLPTSFTDANMGTTNTKMPYFAAHA